MSVFQRRVFWGCVFALTFAFWFEASGQALTWGGGRDEPLRGAAARANYEAQLLYGLFILGLGALITLTLRPRERPAPYTWTDWCLLAGGLAALAGIALRGWRMVAP